MAKFRLLINGEMQEIDAEPEMPLLWVLRDLFDLTGTKYGCGEGVCGACTVHLNGRAVRSCQLTISAASEQSVTTIEGLSQNNDHPVQQAWLEMDVPQCGFCQSGQIMQAADLLRQNAAPSNAEIEQAMAGNLCRCGTYYPIKEAIQKAAKSSVNVFSFSAVNDQEKDVNGADVFQLNNSVNSNSGLHTNIQQYQEEITGKGNE